MGKVDRRTLAERRTMFEVGTGPRATLARGGAAGTGGVAAAEGVDGFRSGHDDVAISCERLHRFVQHDVLLSNRPWKLRPLVGYQPSVRRQA